MLGQLTIESAAAALCGRSSKQFAHFPGAF